jgi:hypothetical protein
MNPNNHNNHNNNNLVCNSFDTQYKRIQSFRNQYLNMIRLVLKHKSKLSFENIMTYNEIENKITDLNKEISILNKSIVKNIKNINDFSSILQNQNQPQVNIEDYRMLQTVTTFLPLMVLFYNSVELINQPTQPQIINRVSHEEGDGYHDNDNENENEEFLRKLRDPTNIYLSLD